MDSALERLDYVAAIYYDPNDPDDLEVVEAFDAIVDECKQNDIRLVKTGDAKLLAETGVEDGDSPVLIYHENDVPFLYAGGQPLTADDLDSVLNWLVEQRNTAAIEEVSDETS